MTFSIPEICTAAFLKKRISHCAFLFVFTALFFSINTFASDSYLENSLKTDQGSQAKQLSRKTYDNSRMSTGSMDGIYALGLEIIWPLTYFKHGATVIRSLASALSTFDGFCGALELQTQDNWLIKEVIVKNGSIVNQFQFLKGGDNFFSPKEPRNARVIQLRPTQAYLEYYRLYPSGNPIDADVIVYNSEEPDEESRLHITKSVCSPAQLGRVSAGIVTGEKIPFYVRHSELYADAWAINQISSEYYTSSYILIPHKRSKFPDLNDDD